MEQDDIDYLAASVQQSIPHVASRFGVEFVTLHLFRGGKDAQDIPYVRTNYPEAWVSHYLLNDYVRIDPVLQMAEATDAPFCWSSLRLEPAHAEMMQQAAEHGVWPTGFSACHVDPIGRRSVLSCNARVAQRGKTWEPFLAEHRDHLTRLVAKLHQMALGEVSIEIESLPVLSPRELECLKWTAAGKAHTEIAIILNLSEHTVRSYLKDARTKLDSVTLAQAVSKASSLGLL